MNRRRIPYLILLGVCCGALVSFAYMNPYTGKITLSELVLQMSGARGAFQLGLSLVDLLSYSARLVPYFLFELYMGTNLYRHFCTASVYVFSRTPNRIRWYGKECFAILAAACLYQAILFLSEIGVAQLRYELVWDQFGLFLMLLHFVLYGLGLFAITLLVNLLSAVLGSEIAFTGIMGGQAALIALLALLRALENAPQAYALALNLNPMAHLVLGWQAAATEGAEAFVPGVESSLLWPVSCAYLSCNALAVIAAGGVLICRHELLITDAEFGGV